VTAIARTRLTLLAWWVLKKAGFSLVMVSTRRLIQQSLNLAGFHERLQKPTIPSNSRAMNQDVDYIVFIGLSLLS
jgi:hypothetical protein